MNKQTEALKTAIEALEDANNVVFQEWSIEGEYNDAIQACKEALEQPAQEQVACNSEPVAFIDVNWAINYTEHGVNNCYEPTFNPNGKVNVGDKLYTHPAPSWQGLSDFEIGEIYDGAWMKYKGTEKAAYHLTTGFARAIEQALRSKNESV